MVSILNLVGEVIIDVVLFFAKMHNRMHKVTVPKV